MDTLVRLRTRGEVESGLEVDRRHIASGEIEIRATEI